MSFASLLVQTARIERYSSAVDDYGNESGGAWNLVSSVPARYQEIFATLDREGRSVNVLRWQCYVQPTDVTLEDRVVNPDTNQTFHIVAIDPEYGRSTLHHLTLWMGAVVE